ncbi:hypothetical protein ZWY2020_056551, partial [Hordeum vulgare]
MSEAVGTPESGGGGGVKEQERFLPIANIGRIMASDKCMKEKRKTISTFTTDRSMGTLGFEDYVEPLKLYLKLYRETLWRLYTITQTRRFIGSRCTSSAKEEIWFRLLFT